MKKFKSILAMSLAMFAFASCSNNDETVADGLDNVPTGESTYASFRFQLEGATLGNRASMIEDGETTEVKDIRLFIFDGNSLDGKLEVNKLVTANSNVTVQTTSGVKRIYVIANSGDKGAINTKLESVSTLREFYNLATDGKGTLDDLGDEFKELVKGGTLLMSNIADINAKKTLQPGVTESQSMIRGEENNNFDFSVQRAVAKGNLKIQLDGGTLATKDGFVLEPAAAVSVRNLNRSTFMVQQYSSHDLNATDYDHESDGAFRQIAPFYNVFDNMLSGDLLNPDTFVPYYFKGYGVNPVDGKSVTIANADAVPSKTVVFPGNSNNKSLRGNTTYFGIRTQVKTIPRDMIAAKLNYSTSGGINISSEPAGTDYDGTQGFYYVREIPNDVMGKLSNPVRKVFTTQAGALEAMYVILTYSKSVSLQSVGFTPSDSYTLDELIAAYIGNTLVPADIALIKRYIGHYDQGYSYYRLNLYETAKPSNTKRHIVRRNHVYQATVSAFATIGEPNEGDLDKEPEKPVDADATYVTAIINIAPWHVVNMGDEL